ncbi:hypothetical protein [Luteimicrobium album]|uniref:hypothetical protein n=1 Tax=Luteimicrobium album TaxID=1054550 RepID=UPI0024E0CF43|nr:hypothetical protein [Luteimicrobium album]
MTKNPLTLRDVALRASERAGGLQGRALDREAKRRGLTLSYTTVDKIIAGTYTSRPTRRTLEALAELSGVPLVEVLLAAREPLPVQPLAELLPPDADLLSADQRRVVVDIVRQFARSNRELDEARRDAESSAALAPDALALAARPGVPAAAPDATSGEESQDSGSDEPS